MRRSFSRWHRATSQRFRETATLEGRGEKEESSNLENPQNLGNSNQGGGDTWGKGLSKILSEGKGGMRVLTASKRDARNLASLERGRKIKEKP